MTWKHVFYTNFEYYKVFYFVVKYKSMSLASEKMSISQPAVTKTIRRLEEDLGCTLFTRTKHGIVLTAEGEALWSRLEKSIELIIAAEKDLEAIQTLGGGTLSIASMEMGFTTYILPALRSFLTAYPKIKVRFRSGTPNQIIDMLKNGIIDLAVLSPPFEQSEALECRVIDTYHEVLFVGHRYSFLADREFSLQELSQYPFISMPEGTPGKEYMKDCFRDQGLLYEPDIEVSSMEFVIHAVEADFGIGTAPYQAVQSRLENGDLYQIKLKTELPARQAIAVTGQAREISKATKIFLNEFLDVHPRSSNA